jgi:hypothetical protein
VRRGVVGEAHRTKVAQHIILKKMFNLNPKAYTQGPCCSCYRRIEKMALFDVIFFPITLSIFKVKNTTNE